MILAAPIVITMQRSRKPIIWGGVIIRRSRIVDIGPVDALIRSHPSQQVHLLENAVLMPGLINLHAHIELPPLLPLVKGASFSDWVLNLIRAKRGLKPAQYREAVRTNVREILRSGTTTVGEICTQGESPHFLHKAALRSYIFREVIQMTDKPVTAPSSRHCRGMKQAGLMHFGLSPHATYTVAAPVLRDMRSRYGRGTVKIAMHIAESRDETLLLQGRTSGLDRLYRFAHWDPSLAPQGTSPVQYLHDIGFLNQNLIAVHAVHLSARDIQLLKRSRVSVAHCPRSNRSLNAGTMRLKQLLDAGVTVGLGTDSLASVSTLNMWDEMRYAYRIHRSEGIVPRQVFELATANGAKALGLEQDIGTLAAGKRADLIALPLPAHRAGDLYADILRETRFCVLNMVNGNIVYQDQAGTWLASSIPSGIQHNKTTL